MKKRILGKDLEVSAVGLGCMGMSHAYGVPADKKEMTELLAQAVDMGYTFFDTAEVYGTDDDPHDNEKLLGEALKPYRDKIVLASKFGLTFDIFSGNVPYPLVPDSRPETIRKSIEGTLQRLQTDHLDLCHLVLWQMDYSQIVIQKIQTIVRKVIIVMRCHNFNRRHLMQTVIC